MFGLIIGDMVKSRPAPDDATAALIAEALIASRETRRIEFKREFSGNEPGAWCEPSKMWQQ